MEIFDAQSRNLFSQKLPAVIMSEITFKNFEKHKKKSRNGSRVASSHRALDEAPWYFIFTSNVQLL
ncbi:hypothetical protein MIMGU_mgv1a017621mg [Erythranthe guttata]|uniref:Uncharacterized protein n=1 Tax=Erythranthe guttata TaxID=4155 RepID=A0A022RH39_ERYGU|nr:hypothetical protein MIMGU_mgv1a017621mg [Erythranthe guttata]